MQIPVMNGIYANDVSDLRTSYPVNLVPVPKENGISNGYLRPAEGVELLAETDGLERGGIVWNGVLYRVIGSNLCTVSSTGDISIIGDVGSGGICNLDYSFDYLAINSGSDLYLLKGGTLKRVTDSDLGLVKDVIWIDGYFMTTDGNYLIVTELNNPFEVNALKYGSAELDPDPVQSLAKIRNEVYAVGRYTIELFDNVGGENFPFARIDGAAIPRGSLSTTTSCVFMEMLAFVGGGKNEPPAIYLGTNGQSNKISNREIDQILSSYTEAQLSSGLLEARILDGHQWLYFHLPDQTIVYDLAATQATQNPVWFILKTNGKYCARNFTWAYNKWVVGHATQNKLGVTTNEISSHFGEVVDWEFGTIIVYNEGRGVVFHQLELVCLTGHIDFNKDPVISTQYSIDGETWSTERFIRSGGYAHRAKHLIWLQQGYMRNWRIQKFKGNSDSRLSIIRLDAKLEQLAV